MTASDGFAGGSGFLSAAAEALALTPPCSDNLKDPRNNPRAGLDAAVAAGTYTRPLFSST